MRHAVCGTCGPVETDYLFCPTCWAPIRLYPPPPEQQTVIRVKVLPVVEKAEQ